MIRLGLVSDTHGLVRPEALEALRGVDRILHMGDVGTPEVLERLGEVAPITAVRGNVDKGAWARALPETEVVEADGLFLYLLHDIDRLDLDPEAAGFAAVLHGHSHRPRDATIRGVRYLNPGSIGPLRFRLPVALALATVRDGTLDVQPVVLDDRTG